MKHYSASKAQGKKGGYTDEVVKKDRGGYQIGQSEECEAYGHISRREYWIW